MNSAHPIEDKAGAPGTGVKIIASKSTATQAQRERILALLRISPKSTIDLRRAGIMQTSTRIFELRRRGHNIVTARCDLFDADGHRHERVAIYSLVGEPGSVEGPLLAKLPVTPPAPRSLEAA